VAKLFNWVKSNETRPLVPLAKFLNYCRRTNPSSTNVWMCRWRTTTEIKNPLEADSYRHVKKSESLSASFMWR